MLRRLGPVARVVVPLTVLGGVAASVTAVAVTEAEPTSAASVTAFELGRQTSSASDADTAARSDVSAAQDVEGALTLEGVRDRNSSAPSNLSAAEKLGLEAQAQAAEDEQARQEAARAAEASRKAEAERAAAAAAENARQQALAQAARDASRDPRSLARLMAAQRGWGDSQFSCLDALWQKESGWNPAARNPSSGAFGIPQSLPGSKMAAAGSDWQTNPATQIEWGLDYIAGVYGTPCGAWGHSQATNWY